MENTEEVQISSSIDQAGAPRQRRAQIPEKYRKQFDGSRGFNGLWYRRPTRQIPEEDEVKEYAYKNQLGKEFKKQRDVVVYLSSSEYAPRRLLVQATDKVWKEQPNTQWRRTKLAGDVPRALKLSQWALEPADPEYVKSEETGDLVPKRRSFLRMSWCYCLVALRTVVVCIPLQIWLAFGLSDPPWTSDDIEQGYRDWPGYSWSWPKYSVNPLDMQPNPEVKEKKKNPFSVVPRLVRPRLLVTKDSDGEWTVKDLDANEHLKRPYVMVSYTNRHYNTNYSQEGRDKLEAAAKRLATEAGCEAYWMDFKCRADTTEPELLTSDVNRFCDVIRGANRVVVALPDSKDETALVWGDRMWTLPEGLLVTGNKVYFHYTDMPAEGELKTQSLTKVEMAGRVWRDKPRGGEDIKATRLLAEHFTGGLNLGRLELFSVALHALSDRQVSESKPEDRPELAYALMGLLNYRIDEDCETLFQAIARVSLRNDTDQLLERMLCLLPEPEASEAGIFQSLAQADQFNTHLWDIKPLCHVVGIADSDQTVVVDSARAIPIRWKNFPRLRYRRADGFLKLLAELFVRSGIAWFIGGFTLAYTYAPFLIALLHTNDDTNPERSQLRIWVGWAIMLFFLIGILLSFAAPASCRRLFGGRVTEMSPHFVGFEGTLPLEELEKVVFGNYGSRLTYDPSSTKFALRHLEERRGMEPEWVTKSDSPPLLRDNHRVFTIVDTGNLTVSIIQTVNPPTVALICGREGGMLRALLCSWDFTSDTLYRETVIRLTSDCVDMAVTKSWLRVCLKQSSTG